MLQNQNKQQVEEKMLDNLDLEEIQPSSRKYPGITFHQERDAGNQILSISGLSKVLQTVFYLKT